MFQWTDWLTRTSTVFPDECAAMIPGDYDLDGRVDLADLSALVDCASQPGSTPSPLGATTQRCLQAFDADADGDVDLADYRSWQIASSGE